MLFLTSILQMGKGGPEKVKQRLSHYPSSLALEPMPHALRYSALVDDGDGEEVGLLN